MGAKIPKKIAVQSPQQHSVEMLEMIYRLFTSALKMMAPHNCSTIGKYMKKIMKKPVIEKHLFKDDDANPFTSQSPTGEQTLPKQFRSTCSKTIWPLNSKLYSFCLSHNYYVIAATRELRVKSFLSMVFSGTRYLRTDKLSLIQANYLCLSDRFWCLSSFVGCDIA